jgi:hypothetical protein
MPKSYTLTQVDFTFNDKKQVERGTGKFDLPVELVVLETVTGSPQLAFGSASYRLDAFLFHIDAKVVPSWFGVAVPERVRKFDNVNIFFHPQPKQANLDDKKYAEFTRDPGWVAVFRYVNMLGLQLAASTRNQVLIMPFLTQGAASGGVGIFNADWQGIVHEILVQLKRKYIHAVALNEGLTDLVVSSFSSGITYSHQFRTGGADVRRYLREVYDFDGARSTESALSHAVVTTRACKGWRYDQQGKPDVAYLRREGVSGRFHLPIERWPKCHPPPANPDDVHALIIQRMFWHALAHSRVGL